MKKNILILIILFCFSLFNTSCSINGNSAINKSDSQINDTKEKQNSIIASSNNLRKDGDKSEIILSTGTISNDLRVVGVKDEKNFYCCGSDNKNVYIYSVDKDSKSVLVSTISSQKYIKSVCVNDKWIVWVEDEIEVENDNSHDLNWSAYAKNLNTGELIEIDRYKKIILKPGTINTKLEPFEFSLFDDKVVYDCYDVSKDNTTFAVIKLYDLTKKSIQIIDTNKNYEDGFYSHPKIFNNFITWSLSKCNMSNLSEKGSTYIYNIEDKEKELITSGTDILWPYINQNYIAARVKPNGLNDNSSIVLYDLKKKDGWSNIISRNSGIYKNNNSHIEIGMPIISGQYLIWQDNVNSNVAIYNCMDKKLYNLTEKVGKDDRVYPIGIYNKIIFWNEIKNQGINKQTTTCKYAVLK